MPKVTRRRFIQGASVGAAAVGALGAVPHFFGSQDKTAPVAARAVGGSSALAAGAVSARSQSSAAAAEQVVAYVRDLSKGEIVIYSGTHQVVHYDRELAGRLQSLA